MSNAIVEALQKAAGRVGKTLSEDAAKAVSDLYKDAGDRAKAIAQRIEQTEAGNKGQFEKILKAADDVGKDAAKGEAATAKDAAAGAKLRAKFTQMLDPKGPETKAAARASTAADAEAKREAEAAAARLQNERRNFEETYRAKAAANAGAPADRESLLAELRNNGVKFDEGKLIRIGRGGDGSVNFLEEGNPSAGFQHVLKHEGEFTTHGITHEQLPDFAMAAASSDKIVGFQGKGMGRPIKEFTFGGRVHQVGITVGDNGFIVGANPVKSWPVEGGGAQ